MVEDFCAYVSQGAERGEILKWPDPQTFKGDDDDDDF